MYFFSRHEEGHNSKKFKTEEGGVHFSLSGLAEVRVTQASGTSPACFAPCRQVMAGGDCVDASPLKIQTMQEHPTLLPVSNYCQSVTYGIIFMICST